jgi:hypothetical protein
MEQMELRILAAVVVAAPQEQRQAALAVKADPAL